MQQVSKSRRFLEHNDGNLLLQVTKEPKRKGAVLDLAVTNKERDWWGR